MPNHLIIEQGYKIQLQCAVAVLKCVHVETMGTAKWLRYKSSRYWMQMQLCAQSPKGFHDLLA